MLSQSSTTAYIEHDEIVCEPPTTGTLEPSVAARLIARVRSCSLDRELIAGADPARSPQLAARARRLASTRERTLLAEGLERLLRGAQGPQRRWWSVSRREVLLDNTAELSDLASLLRSGTPLYARGIAIVRNLLTDGTGAAYFGGAEHLRRQLREARVAMCG